MLTKQVKAQEEPCRLNKSESCCDFRTMPQKTDQRAMKDSENKHNFKKWKTQDLSAAQ